MFEAKKNQNIISVMATTTETTTKKKRETHKNVNISQPITIVRSFINLQTNVNLPNRERESEREESKSEKN